jgi:molybdopterin-guanine dinucleotide biosynthesis protein A
VKIESAILAGGKNSRYGGQNKAFIKVEGLQIIDRNIAVLSKLFPRISIITNHAEQFSAYSLPMSSDYFHEIGPLAGIHSALKNAISDGVFISSCDMPFLDKGMMKTVLNIAEAQNVEAVIPRVNGDLEPLFAFYSKRILSRLEVHIKESRGRSIRSFLKTINTVFIDFEAADDVRKAFTNINRPEDLKDI